MGTSSSHRTTICSLCRARPPSDPTSLTSVGGGSAATQERGRSEAPLPETSESSPCNQNIGDFTGWYPSSVCEASDKQVTTSSLTHVVTAIFKETASFETPCSKFQFVGMGLLFNLTRDILFIYIMKRSHSIKQLKLTDPSVQVFLRYWPQPKRIW